MGQPADLRQDLGGLVEDDLGQVLAVGVADVLEVLPPLIGFGLQGGLHHRRRRFRGGNAMKGVARGFTRLTSAWDDGDAWNERTTIGGARTA